MSTFEKSYSQPVSNNWRTVTFTIPFELHLQLQEIVSKEGKKVTRVLLELLTEAIEARNTKEPNRFEKPTDRLYADLKKVRERREILHLLAEIKGDVSEEDFTIRCHSLGFESSDVEEIAPHRGGSKKRDRCKAFLRVLFVDRPEGLPVSRVLETAESEGFGRDMTRDVAHESGYIPEWGMVNGKRISFWKFPSNGTTS